MDAAILELPGLAIDPTPARAARAPASCGLDPHNPWPGLAAYDEASHDYFHGREDDAAGLLRLLRVAPLTVLYGKSGLGKSSLLQAGVFPQLRREHYLPVYVRLDFSERALCPPLEQIVRRVDEEIERAGAECAPRSPGEGLWQFLHRRDLEIWSADNFLLTPVLVLDQFEELFSQAGRHHERVRAVFDDLADLIENRIPAELAAALGDHTTRARLDINSQPYRVVLSFREDFLPEIECWKDKVPSLLRNRLRLLPMSRAQAVSATARAGAAVLDEEVARRIVDLVAPEIAGGAANAGGAAEVEPVLLSLCCTRLNRRRAPEGRIDANLVACAGSDILRDFFIDALEGMPARVAEFIETHLIQGDRYRGSYPREAAIAEGRLAAGELAVLTDRHHLLRIDQQQGVARIELIHDRLVGIVRTARDERLARRKRRQRLGGFVIAMVCVAAGLGFWSDGKKKEALASSTRATVLRLVVEAQRMFSGAQLEDGDRGVLQALTADGLAEGQADVHASLLGAWSLHPERKLIAMQDTVPALAFTSDGAGIVSTGPDHSLRVLDAASGQPTGIRFVGHRAWIWAVAASADGRLLVSGSEDKTLRIWDARTGRELAQARHPFGVSAVAISADASRIATASHDEVVRLWDARTAKLVAALEGHGAPASALAFSPDGRLLLSGGSDGTLRLWDGATGDAVGWPIQADSGAVSTVAFSPDGRRILAGGTEGRVRIWDAATLTPLPGLDARRGGTVKSIAISPDGKTLVSGSWEDGSLRIWNVRTGRTLGPAIPAHRGGVMRVAFSPDGKLVASGGLDKTLRLWDADFAQSLGTPLEGAGTRGWKGIVSADGRLAAGAGEDGSLRLWDAGSGERLATLADGRPGTVSALASSPDRSHVAAAGEDGMVRVWQAADGRLVAEFRAGSVASLAFGPDGQRIATGGKDGALRLWETASGAPVGEPRTGHDDSILGLAFSRDGKRIASASADETVRLWDLATGAPPLVLVGHPNRVLSVAFSPDGRRVVSGGSEDATLRLWDVETGQPLGEPWEGHLGGIGSVAFSADGRTVASASWDKTLRLWDAATGAPIGAPLAGHAESVIGVAFSADGRQLVSASTDGSLRHWPAPASWRQELCAKLSRNLSHKQWKTSVSANIPYTCQCPGLPIAPDQPGADAEAGMCGGAPDWPTLPRTPPSALGNDEQAPVPGAG